MRRNGFAYRRERIQGHCGWRVDVTFFFFSFLYLSLPFLFLFIRFNTSSSYRPSSLEIISLRQRVYFYTLSMMTIGCHLLLLLLSFFSSFCSFLLPHFFLLRRRYVCVRGHASVRIYACTYMYMRAYTGVVWLRSDLLYFELGPYDFSLLLLFPFSKTYRASDLSPFPPSTKALIIKRSVKRCPDKVY